MESDPRKTLERLDRADTIRRALLWVFFAIIAAALTLYLILLWYVNTHGS
jgi:hypothetical protein